MKQYGFVPILTVGLVLGLELAAAPVSLFVSPAGDDGAPGSRQQPLATLGKALAQLRELRTQGNLSEGAVINLCGGSHYLQNTLILDAKDSGSETAPVLIRSAEDESAILVGGRTVKGWQIWRDGIFRVDLKAAGYPDYRFRQLFYKGKRMYAARRPNAVPDAPYCGGWAFVPGKRVPLYRESDEWSRDQFPFRPEDFPMRWAHPEDAEVQAVPRYTWWNSIRPVASVDWDQAVIHVGKPIVHQMRPGNRFYVQGVLEELDAPGEWYLDPREYVLYFLPTGPLADGDVTVSQVTQMIKGNHVSHLTFRDLTFECSDSSAIDLRAADHCAVIGCTLRNLSAHTSWGGAAIQIQRSVNCRVAGNDISFVGSEGIRMDGGDPETLTPANHVIENNYIHHTGVFFKPGNGIYVNGVGSRITHNLIHDCPRGAITWHGWDHVMEFNHIRHTNLETSDTAGNHNCNTSWTKRGTIVRYNYIHDLYGLGQNHLGEWQSPYYCFGIYLDNWTCGTTVYGNILARIHNGCIYIHGGRDNVIENNILVDGASAQMCWSAWKPKTEESLAKHGERLLEATENPAYAKYPGLREMVPLSPEERCKMAGNAFRRNIVCYTGEKANAHSATNLYAGLNVSDRNLYWRAESPLTNRIHGGQKKGTVWEEWLKLGYDRDSVIADPLFVAPDKDDFRLRPGSPAERIGFEPIPFDKIGCYASAERATWPIVEAEGVREHPLRLDLLPQPEPEPSPPLARVPRKAAPSLDGVIGADEWGAPSLKLGKAADVWLRHDGSHLHVAFRNRVDTSKPLTGVSDWGKGDAVEVALRAAGTTPIAVLRGFPSGAFLSTPEAGAPAPYVQALQERAKFAAREVRSGLWEAEWSIPWDALRVAPQAGVTLEANFTLHRVASGNEWIQWHRTGKSSWQVNLAGRLVLEN